MCTLSAQSHTYVLVHTHTPWIKAGGLLSCACVSHRVPCNGSLWSLPLFFLGPLGLHVVPLAHRLPAPGVVLRACLCQRTTAPGSCPLSGAGCLFFSVFMTIETPLCAGSHLLPGCFPFLELEQHPSLQQHWALRSWAMSTSGPTSRPCPLWGLGQGPRPLCTSRKPPRRNTSTGAALHTLCSLIFLPVIFGIFLTRFNFSSALNVIVIET